MADVDVPLSDDELLEEPTDAGRDLASIEKCLREIVQAQPEWSVGTRLEQVAWIPHLVRERDGSVLHVHFSDEVPAYVERRLTAAASSGLRVHVVLLLEHLYDGDVLNLLSEVDASVVVYDDPTSQFSERHFMAAMADLGVPVDPGMRKELGRKVWGRIEEGSNHVKGRRLEALAAFLLGQVTDLRVASRNFRTATAEIDIVLRVDNFGGGVWNHPGVPFVLVEGKNRKDPAGQPMMSALIRRLETSRGRARIGVLVSVSGFSSDAEREELRLSATDLCVVMLDGEAVEALIESERVDNYLENLVMAAMLR